MRSTRSSSRARTEERGFALTAALLLAVLYFGLMELLLLDATRALRDAQRFRAHVIAATLAEDAAELAAAGMVNKNGQTVERKDAAGEVSGAYTRSGCCKFELTGEATARSVPAASAQVTLQGSINGQSISIDFANHSH